jgi:putative aminopeptidase FrvX
MKRAAFVLLAGLFAAGAAVRPLIAQERTTAWDLLRQLLLVPGVSGHEGPVADFIRKTLPERLGLERDEMNNVWFTAGSGKPHILFVAHSDELGWIVDRITPEGRVRLKQGGGLLPQACEAQPVLIQTAKGPVPGIIAPRPGYDERRRENVAPPQPYAAENFEIVLGAASEQAARDLGVSEGDPVAPKKVFVDFSPSMMSARAVDDRAGCAALLDAALRIDWTRLKGKTITFAWDVQEETGLFGATALAKVLKPDYVFAIDTFVSSDSPLESKRFADLEIGKGAVVRAIDSSNITPAVEIRRIVALARAHRIPVQAGNSRGGNDGSVFLAAGAVDIPLSWPGSYAHSLIEKIDRADLDALSALVQAIVKDWN